VEEGLFPHQMSLDEPGRLAEERRLCYVGITRARERLYLTHAETRRLYGNETYPHRSRFVSEIPAELMEEVRMGGTISYPASSAGNFSSVQEPSVGGMKLGQRVIHAKFGDGVVLNLEGQGAQARVQVNFDGLGSKWLMMEYANLQAV
jgi:DNA helicase-2/ATP-dependent DNA helicase PcrA